MILEAPHVLVTCTRCQGRGTIAAAAEAKMREAVTTVPCPVCEHCAACDGAHMVTPARAVELRKRQPPRP